MANTYTVELEGQEMEAVIQVLEREAVQYDEKAQAVRQRAASLRAKMENPSQPIPPKPPAMPPTAPRSEGTVTRIMTPRGENLSRIYEYLSSTPNQGTVAIAQALGIKVSSASSVLLNNKDKFTNDNGLWDIVRSTPNP